MKTSERYTIAVAGLGRRIATVIRHLAAAAPHIEIVAHADPAPTALMQELSPGTSPPPVRIPIRISPFLYVRGARFIFHSPPSP